MQVRTIIAALRIRELLPKLGFVWAGCLFSDTELSVGHLVPMLEAGAIAFVCGLSVFSFNSYTGYETDRANDRLKDLGNIPKISYLIITIIATLSGSLALLCLWDFRSLIGIAVLILWHLYSMKNGLKSIPIGGPAVAYFTQLLQFGFGYLYFQNSIGIEGIILASLFGFLVTGGHMIHECIDLEADKLQGFRTTAVKLGLHRSLWLGWACFMIAFVHLPFLITRLGTELRVLTLVPPCLFIVALHPAFVPALRNLFFYRRLYLGAMALAILVYTLLIFKI